MNESKTIASTEPPARILVRGVNWLGDAVMTTPALRRLGEHWPDSEITLLTPAKLADLWEHHPNVHHVISIQPDESPWSVGRRLRSGRFELAMIFPNSPRAALEVFWGRVPLRIGYARPWRNWLLTKAVAPRSDETKMRKRTVSQIQALTSLNSSPAARPSFPKEAHHIFQYLRLVEAVGATPLPCAPFLHVTDEEMTAAREAFVADLNLGIPWLGLNPGAEYGPAKRWPTARFVKAANSIHRQSGCAWLLFGGAGDTQLTGIIKAAMQSEIPSMPVVDLAGQTTLRQVAALMRRCRCVLTNDSGPMHLAAAVGTPVVAIFGSTSPELTGPGIPVQRDQSHHVLRVDVPCSPCFLRVCPIDFRCMKGIQVSEVVAAVLRQLQ